MAFLAGSLASYFFSSTAVVLRLPGIVLAACSAIRLGKKPQARDRFAASAIRLAGQAIRHPAVAPIPVRQQLLAGLDLRLRMRGKARQAK